MKPFDIHHLPLPGRVKEVDGQVFPCQLTMFRKVGGRKVEECPKPSARLGGCLRMRLAQFVNLVPLQAPGLPVGQRQNARGVFSLRPWQAAPGGCEGVANAGQQLQRI